MGINAPTWQPLPTISPPTITLPNINFLTGQISEPPEIQIAPSRGMPTAPSLSQYTIPDATLDFTVPSFPSFIKLLTEIETTVISEYNNSNTTITGSADINSNKNVNSNTFEHVFKNVSNNSDNVIDRNELGNLSIIGDTVGNIVEVEDERGKIDINNKETIFGTIIDNKQIRVNEAAIREHLMYKYYMQRKEFLNKMGERNLMFVSGDIQDKLFDMLITEKHEILNSTIHTDLKNIRNINSINNEIGYATNNTGKQSIMNELEKSITNEKLTGIGKIAQTTVGNLTDTKNANENSIETGVGDSRSTKTGNKSSSRQLAFNGRREKTARDDSDLVGLALNYVNKAASVSAASLRTNLGRIIGNLKNEAAFADASAKAVQSYVTALGNYAKVNTANSITIAQRSMTQSMFSANKSLMEASTIKNSAIKGAASDEFKAQGELLKAMVAELSITKANNAMQSAYAYKANVMNLIVAMEKSLVQSEVMHIKNQGEVAKIDGVLASIRAAKARADAAHARAKGKELEFDAKAAGVKGMLEAAKIKLQTAREKLKLQIDKAEQEVIKSAADNKIQIASFKEGLADKKIQTIGQIANQQERGYKALGEIEASGIAGSAELRENIQGQVLRNLGDIEGSMAEQIAEINSQAKLIAQLEHAISRM